jgi:tetratricopeptide (TPR) repeat protein
MDMIAYLLMFLGAGSCALRAAASPEGGAACGTAPVGTLPPVAAQDPGDLRMRSGLAAYRRGALEEAATEWLVAARQFASEEEPGLQAEALARAAQARGTLGLAGESQQLLESALEIATLTDDPERIGAILGALARSYADLGDRDRAAAKLEQALQRAREAREPGLPPTRRPRSWRAGRAATGSPHRPPQVRRGRRSGPAAPKA